jgi:TonB family protein
MMKNLKIYLLLILGMFAVSTVFTSELIAQTKKKPRKKIAKVKKKIARKKVYKVYLPPKFVVEGEPIVLQGSASSESTNEENSIPNPTPKPIPKTVSGGVVNGKALELVKPAYPPAAKAVKASGAVNIEVTIDEEGNVISASAISGHPLLRAAAVSAARQSKFSPTTLLGQRVKVTGVIVYNFTPK